MTNEIHGGGVLNEIDFLDAALLIKMVHFWIFKLLNTLPKGYSMV